MIEEKRGKRYKGTLAIEKIRNKVNREDIFQRLMIGPWYHSSHLDMSASLFNNQRSSAVSLDKIFFCKKKEKQILNTELEQKLVIYKSWKIYVSKSNLLLIKTDFQWTINDLQRKTLIKDR